MSKQRSVKSMQRGQAKFKAQSANRANAAKGKAVRPKAKLAATKPASSGRVVRPTVKKQGSVKSMQAKQAKLGSKKRFTMTKPVSRNR